MLIEMPRYGRGFTGEFYYVAFENYILIVGSTLIGANCAPHTRTINGGCCINDTTTIDHAIINAIKMMLRLLSVIYYRMSFLKIWALVLLAEHHIVFKSCNISSDTGNSVQA